MDRLSEIWGTAWAEWGQTREGELERIAGFRSDRNALGPGPDRNALLAPEPKHAQERLQVRGA